MTHPIIKKILKLETLEKELLGEQNMTPFYASRFPKPIESEWVKSERQLVAHTRKYRVKSNHKHCGAESGSNIEPNDMPVDELISHLQAGGKLKIKKNKIWIYYPDEHYPEDDATFKKRLTFEKSHFENKLHIWYDVEARYNYMDELTQAITNLNAEIDKELENPEILAIVETFLKSTNNH